MVFTREKNDTSNQKPQRCVSFAPKFPPFIVACSAASHTFNEKSFTQRKGKTEQDVSLLCFLSELLCLSFHLSLR